MGLVRTVVNLKPDRQLLVSGWCRDREAQHVGGTERWRGRWWLERRYGNRMGRDRGIDWRCGVRNSKIQKCCRFPNTTTGGQWDKCWNGSMRRGTMLGMLNMRWQRDIQIKTANKQLKGDVDVEIIQQGDGNWSPEQHQHLQIGRGRGERMHQRKTKWVWCYKRGQEYSESRQWSAAKNILRGSEVRSEGCPLNNVKIIADLKSF